MYAKDISRLDRVTKKEGGIICLKTKGTSQDVNKSSKNGQ